MDQYWIYLPDSRKQEIIFADNLTKAKEIAALLFDSYETVRPAI